MRLSEFLLNDGSIVGVLVRLNMRLCGITVTAAALHHNEMPTGVDHSDLPSFIVRTPYLHHNEMPTGVDHHVTDKGEISAGNLHHNEMPTGVFVQRQIDRAIHDNREGSSHLLKS